MSEGGKLFGGGIERCVEWIDGLVFEIEWRV